MKLSKQWLVDTAERVVGTFLEAFVATLVVSASGVSLTAVKTAALAGLASALTLVKSLVGAYVGNPDSASVIPSVGAAPAPAQSRGDGVIAAFSSVSPENLVTPTEPVIATPSSAVPRPLFRPDNRGQVRRVEIVAPSPLGAIPADRVTPLYPSPQQSQQS